MADRIVPGDFESWFEEFEALGRRVWEQTHDHATRERARSARNAYFRAASYFRTADFRFWRAAVLSFNAAVSATPAAVIL